MDWINIKTVLSLAALVIALTSLVISLKTRRLHASNTLSDVYNRISTLALSDENNLIVLDTLYYPEFADQDIEEKRRRWAIIISLNAAEHAFIAKRYKAIPPKVATPILDDLLRSLLKSRDVQDILKQGYWDSEFKTHANKFIDNAH